MDKIPKTEVFAWSMGFVGTGIGAGILFLPIQAGVGGIVCFFLSAIVAFSLSYVSHKVFTKLVIDSKTPKDFPQIVQNNLGTTFSLIATILFFLLMLGYLSVYIVGFNVGIAAYLQDLGIAHSELSNTIWFPTLILIILMTIVSLNERIVIKIMGFITFPLIILLLFLSLYLIPYWNLNFFFHIPPSKELLVGFFANIPILIFAALFFPPISAMVLHYRKSLKENTALVKQEGYKTLRYGQIILIFFTVFFTVSCLFSTPTKDLNAALKTNLNIMEVLARAYNSKVLSFAAPIIAIIALFTSFLGYYFGAKASARNLIAFLYKKKKKNPLSDEKINSLVKNKKTLLTINLVITAYLLFIAIMNFNVGDMLNITCVPIIALLLYIIPFIIFTVSKKYKQYRGRTYYIIIAGGILLLIAGPIAFLLAKVL